MPPLTEIQQETFNVLTDTSETLVDIRLFAAGFVYVIKECEYANFVNIVLDAVDLACDSILLRGVDEDGRARTQLLRLILFAHHSVTTALSAENVQPPPPQHRLDVQGLLPHSVLNQLQGLRPQLSAVTDRLSVGLALRAMDGYHHIHLLAIANQYRELENVKRSARRTENFWSGVCDALECIDRRFERQIQDPQLVRLHFLYFCTDDLLAH